MTVPSDQRGADLYRRFGPLIFARCRRILGDAAAAEDATQEVFVRAFRHLADAPDDRDALKWLYRISTNYCLNVLRDRGRRPVEATSELPELPGENPERGFEDRDLAFKLVQHAPEKLRAPALLHWVDGIDQGRVAEMLQVTRRTVINRLADFSEWARRYTRGEQP